MKRSYFAAIGSFSVKTVKDKYRHAAYHNKHWLQAFKDLLTAMTLHDLEHLKRGFSQFFAIFGCNAHFKSELRRNAWKYTKITCIGKFRH